MRRMLFFHIFILFRTDEHTHTKAQDTTFSTTFVWKYKKILARYLKKTQDAKSPIKTIVLGDLCKDNPAFFLIKYNISNHHTGRVKLLQNQSSQHRFGKGVAHSI